MLAAAVQLFKIYVSLDLNLNSIQYIFSDETILLLEKISQTLHKL
jgi:hypothetical protein